MGALSNYLESGILSFLMRGQSLPSPFNASDTAFYVGLVQTYNATALEEGNMSQEPPDGTCGYYRQAVPRTDKNWEIPYINGNATATHNKSGIIFPPVSGNDLGQVNGVILTDSPTAQQGNILFHGRLTNAKTLLKDSQFIFASGTLKITFD
jgi:hypothetical protein